MKPTMIYILAICASLIGVATAGIISTASLPVASFLFTTTVALALIHHTAKQEGGMGMMIDPDLPPMYQDPEIPQPSYAPTPQAVTSPPVPPSPEPLQTPPAPEPQSPEPTQEEINQAIQDYIDLNKEHSTKMEITDSLMAKGIPIANIKKAYDQQPKNKGGRPKK